MMGGAGSLKQQLKRHDYLLVRTLWCNRFVSSYGLFGAAASGNHFIQSLEIDRWSDKLHFFDLTIVWPSPRLYPLRRLQP